MTDAPVVPGDDNGRADIYLRDLARGSTILVSEAADGTTGNGNADWPRLASDGNTVVFSSAADDLVAGDTNGASDVFLRDLASGSTRRVSVTTDGTELAGTSYPAVSGDGRFVAFAGRLAGEPARMFLHDSLLGTTVPVGARRPCGRNTPDVSDDGRFVAFVSCGEGSEVADAYVHDRVTGENQLISSPAHGTGAAGGVVGDVTMSGDGRFVSFASDAATLVEGDTNGLRDVFVRDRATGVMERVSVGRNGRELPAMSQGPSLARDGSAVAFFSTGPLVLDDTNQVTDVYVKRLTP